jgi:hypothetical protein
MGKRERRGVGGREREGGGRGWREGERDVRLSSLLGSTATLSAKMNAPCAVRTRARMRSIGTSTLPSNHIT